ncbi:MAG: hypothetical protein EOO73_27710 [Myxococcales bacterium]|nr:MAG: hypothetical protein EOO73_27710 [Myxococcales bacterium]
MLLLVLAAVGAGCRAELTVCESVDCVTTVPGDGGSAGETTGTPDTSQGGEAATGGAELGGPSVAGAGEGEQPVVETCVETCPPASACTGAICSYPPDLRMVAYVGNDINGGPSLVAAPLSPLEPLRLDWSADAEEGRFSVPWRPLWAPNGQALVFNMTPADIFSEYSERYYWLDLTLAAPLKPMRILDIPVIDDFAETVWSPDSRRLLVRQAAGAFVVDFANHRARTTRVGSAGSTVGGTAFCADGSVAYNEGGKATIAPVDPSQAPTDFEQFYLSVSPGGRWLLLSDGTTDYVAACTPGATAHSLQQRSSSARWSDGGDYLALANGETEPVTQSVWHLENDGTLRPVLEVSSSAAEIRWQRGGVRLLYRAWENDAPGAYRLLDMAGQPSDRALPIPVELIDGQPSASWVTQSARVLWGYLDDDSESHYFLYGTGDGTEQVTPLGGAEPAWFSKDGEQMLSVEPEAEGVQVWLSRVGAPAERHALFAEPLPCDLKVVDPLPGAPPLLRCTNADDQDLLYALAVDLHSASQISDGTYAYDAALRPVP